MADCGSLRIASVYIPQAKPKSVEDLDRLFADNNKIIVVFHTTHIKVKGG